MALTATATNNLLLSVSRILGMRTPVTIAISPCKPNLMYSVSSYSTISETFKPILCRLKQERTGMPRIIIYCLRVEDCADMYLYFKNELGKNFTEPTDLAGEAKRTEVTGQDERSCKSGRSPGMRNRAKARV